MEAPRTSLAPSSVEFTRTQKIIGGSVILAHLAVIALGLAFVGLRTNAFQAIAPLLRVIR
jgi:type IV secretory pathway VirB3-like protein